VPADPKGRLISASYKVLARGLVGPQAGPRAPSSFAAEIFHAIRLPFPRRCGTRQSDRSVQLVFDGRRGTPG